MIRGYCRSVRVKFAGIGGDVEDGGAEDGDMQYVDMQVLLGGEGRQRRRMESYKAIDKVGGMWHYGSATLTSELGNENR